MAKAMERMEQQAKLRQRLTWLPLIVFVLAAILIIFFVATNFRTFLGIWNRLTQPGMNIPE